ncbi:apolipoprotein N-acyltransferase [Acinetobacter larvae]|uniref:Apolipoprotein N-acyltransferase n=1 Tax=Acinetobacter larvae TaxID=1789224 RepID=A0A1B2LW71_9GAMM|nr:apolipoprotein N-acyltransferase [Acinetobacter larvae]AOA57191.1 apolipoprotein N-acyltransferase [Acinetobacter larvae]
MRSYFDKLKNQSSPIAFIYPLITALLAGGVLSLALAPFYWWWLAILSPALLYACLRQRSAKQAFVIGWAYGFGLWFVGAFWLYTSIHVYGNIAAVWATLLIALMALVMGLFSAVQTFIYRRFFPETPLTFAPLWVLFEWCKTWLFTGFPWLFVGYAFTEYGLDAYAPAFGVFAVSFVAVLLGCALVEILRRRLIWIIPSLLVLLGAWGLSLVQWVSPKNTAPLNVSLVQGNIPQDIKWLVERQQETLDIYNRLTRTEWGRDLIVWPESSIPMLQSDIQPFLLAMDQQGKATGSSWLTGITYFDIPASQQSGEYKLYNSIMASGAQADGLYKKQRLVPFGEYIPLHGLLAWVLPNISNMGFTDLSPGPSNQAAFQVKQYALAAAICYEVAYPNLTRRNAINSDFLVTISNDAWFTGTHGPWQHLQMVQMRAKENGRWFIRATNTGITAFIDAQGHIVQQAPQDQSLVLRGELPAMQGRTWYNLLGDWPILILSGLLLLLGWIYRPRQYDISFKSRR